MKQRSTNSEILSGVSYALSTLEECRAQIREKDKQLLSLIKERLVLGEQVAHIKERKGLPTIDADAEQATMSNLANFAGDLEINKSFARRLGELLIEETVSVQERARTSTSKDQLLKGIFELTQKLVAQGEGITRLEIGEPNFPPSQQVIRGLSDSFRKKKVIGYGPAAGLLELRNALAEELSGQHRTKIDPDQILIVPGGRFGIFATITSFLSPLERAIIPQPAWPAYEECVLFARGRVIALNSTLDNGWEIDIEHLELELRKGARLLVLNSPNNPTGKIIGRKKFEEIVDMARKYQTLILSDEVYDRYAQASPPSVLETEYDNVVYINSFSKQFSLTGWRIAYLVTTKEKARQIRRVVQTAVTCVPEFIQRAALVAVKKGRHQAERNIGAIMKKVDLTCRELDKIDVSFYKPEGAFYVFPKANKPNFDSVSFAKQLLDQHKVSISPGQSFGDYPSFFRLAVSLPERQIPSAIRAIGRAIDSWP
jgi:aspartate aminotransferase